MTGAPASGLTCTECGGSLWVTESRPLRFRCRVGHAFSPESLLIGKQDALEAALWAAVVALEERADLGRRLLRRLEGTGHRRLARRYEDDIEQSARGAVILKNLVNELIVLAKGLIDETEEGVVADAEG